MSNFGCSNYPAIFLLYHLFPPKTGKSLLLFEIMLALICNIRFYCYSGVWFMDLGRIFLNWLTDLIFLWFSLCYLTGTILAFLLTSARNLTLAKSYWLCYFYKLMCSVEFESQLIFCISSDRDRYSDSAETLGLSSRRCRLTS
jgi:hypothetical protein